MLRTTLLRNDGMSSGRPWLRSVVGLLQRGLAEAGADLEADGRFGGDTKDAVETFQEAAGLLPNAVVGKATWGALDVHLSAVTAAERAAITQHLVGFTGDLHWIHEKEGHRGEPYWPGGASGVTLDPGVDLGHQDPDALDRLYGDLLSTAERDLLRPLLGLKGDAARDALSTNATVRALRISAEDAKQLLPHAAAPYWTAITDRFPVLLAAQTLPSVQTVLLSLAYNRGPGNRHLDSLTELLARSDWIAAAHKVRSMQQGHVLSGIRQRRRDEGDLIFAELEYLQA